MHIISMADQNYHNTNMSTSDHSLLPPHSGYDVRHETANFDPSDFLQMEESWLDADFSSFSQLLSYEPNELELNSSRMSNDSFSEEAVMINSDSGGGVKRGIREKVAFKTKSEIEILNDGFKWRKYGKKMVKNSPNPRNYYKCSVERCPVKKRVERDKEDRRYVVTTYEGVHNHEGPTN